MLVHKSNTGFTLIELVVVIVILGVLAVTAAPRFISLKSDAQAATIREIEANVNTLNTFITTKAFLAGVQDGNVAMNDTTTAQVKGGAPVAHWNNNFTNLLNLPNAPFEYTNSTQLCPDPMCGVGHQTNWPVDDATLNATIADVNSNRRAVFIWPRGYRLVDRCFVYYVEKPLNATTETPLIGRIDTDC